MIILNITPKINPINNEPIISINGIRINEVNEKALPTAITLEIDTEMAKNIKPIMAYETGMSVEEWQKEAREKLEELLGLLPGSVSVMGLMNDKTHAVRLLIDGDLLKAAEIGVHPCLNTASLAIATADILQKFLPHTGHTPTTVTLIGE